MNIVSVFDGMGCGAIALKKLGLNFNYFSSEIEKYPKLVSKYHNPSSVQLGDITNISYTDGILHTECGEFRLDGCDLYMGGSPCQSISNLGDGSGLGGKSGLFYEWFRLRNEINPKYWLLENVSGKKSAIDEITRLLGVAPISVCSSLVSAQKRKRLYWTNLPTPPTIIDKNILLKDILDSTPDKITTELKKGRYLWITEGKGLECLAKRYAALDPEKASCLTARGDASWNCTYVTTNGVVRKLSCEEWEKLQTVPVGYTNVEGVPSRERYKMLGNGWTVDVISHLLSPICSEYLIN